MDGKVIMTGLTCFKAYDVRGELGVNFDASIAYRIGRAVARHFKAEKIVVGRDARESSLVLAEALSRGIMDEGAQVLDLGLAGTEEMYWAVTHFGACAGVEVTASHNPINYNGLKIVKSGSRPLDDLEDFQVIKRFAEEDVWLNVRAAGGVEDKSFEARAAYVDRVLNFVDVSALRPLKIVVNSGNGAAGPTFDAVAERLRELGAPTEFIRVHHEPDHSFPNGIPNPLLPENHDKTASVVRSSGADFGVAFDGDFDRCFFFDESGHFVPGEYVIGLIAAIFLEKELGAKIVHDPRVIWNTQDIVAAKGGTSIQSKTGHAFIKQTMRSETAVYGGEMSAHHYFRDFAYCDSGMIPWLLVAELISKSGRSLGAWVESSFKNFPSSGEINFKVKDADMAIQNVLDEYLGRAFHVDRTDGVSLSFENWRFNLRKSNTEALVRLNLEGRGVGSGLDGYLKDLRALIEK
jgi:phosphomannomutase